MNKRVGRRALSLVLALEMLCAPLAMARTEDPAQARAEIPLGDEVQPQDYAELPAASGENEVSDAPAEPLTSSAPASSGSAPAGQAAAAQAEMLAEDAALVRAEGEAVYTAGAIFYGLPLDGRGLLKNSVMRAEYSTYLWGYRDPAYGKPMVTPDDGLTYLFLPDPGRVPDLEFGGFYVYDTGEVRSNTGSGSWCYVENFYSAYWDYNNLENIGWSYDALAGELSSQGKTPIRLDDPANVVDDQNAIYPQVLDSLGIDGDNDAYEGDGVLIALPASLRDSGLYSPDRTHNILPVVGRWNASSSSEVTALSVATASASQAEAGETTAVATVYNADPLGKKAEAMAAHQVSTAGDGWFRQGADNTFWLRVDDDQETLTLTFQTYEPYLAYNGFIKSDGTRVGAAEGTACPVTAEVTFAGQTPQGAADVQIQGQVATRKGSVGSSELNNSYDNPACGLWTVTNIPLTSVSQAAGGDPFTKIVLTVAAPDGLEDHATRYTFYVERQMAPEATLAPGNTPYGMIDRDNGSQWGTGAEGAAKRERAKEAFKTNGFRFEKTLDYLYPHGSVNQGGCVYTGSYFNCWGDINYDLVSEAVVAYQDRAFADPGVSFRDGEGQNITFGDSAADPDYQTCVTRTIQLRTADRLTVGLYGESAGTPCWYDGDADGQTHALRETETSQILRRADGSDVVNLRGLNVLPGIYEMVYTFTDPITDIPVTVRRPLIVLPIPGDADMDGAVTLADAQAVADNASAWSKSTDPVVRLGVGRIFDVNRDGSLSVSGASNDLTTLLAGYQPVLNHDEISDYPYLPLPEPAGIEGYQRLSWSQVQQAADGAQLTLEYLGVESGARQASGHTVSIGGPFNARKTDDKGDPLGVSMTDPKAQANAYQPDTFWVGVKLSGAGALAGSQIKDFGFSLIYNDQYVEPAMVYTMDQGNEFQSQEALANSLFYTYNMASTYVSAGGQTIFTGMTGSDYNYSADATGRSYDDSHYSKVVSHLEEAGGARQLKELKVTLRHKDASANYATVKDGYLMVMAFRLKAYPAGKTEGEQAQLIEMAAGMREFTLVLKKGTGAANGLLATLFQAVEQALDLDATYAYSAQGDAAASGIYGDATANLRQELQYVPSTDAATGLIPLGADTTPRETIYNWVNDGSIPTEDRGEVNGQYDVPFSADLVGRKTENAGESDEYKNQLPYNGVVEGLLPPGLDYSSAGGNISGRPTMAGTFDFSISGKPYRIVIEQKTIRYYAQTMRSYYGQHQYRGNDHSSDYVYRYYAADLSDRELTRLTEAGRTNDGTAETLEWLMKEDPVPAERGVAEADRYAAPIFFANTDTGYVAFNTPVGRYPIGSALPRTVNYRFEYITSDASESGAMGFLTIEPRPIWVDHVSLTAAMTGAAIYDNQKEAVVTLTIDESKLAEEGIFLGFDHRALTELGDGESYIFPSSGLRLSGEAKVPGDKLSVTIAGQYQFDAAKDAGDSYNFMEDGIMQDRIVRSIRVANIYLTTGSDTAKNYSLQSSDQILQVDGTNAVEGAVLRREIRELQIASTPSELYAPEDPQRHVLHPGDWIQSLNSLRIMVCMGDEETGATYAYNASDLSSLEVHYNWVSPKDKEDGERDENKNTLTGTGCVEDQTTGELEDQCPYDPKYDHRDDDVDQENTIFTSEMDGWYLCAVVRRYVNGSLEYVKCYSDYPITVEKKSLTLTVKGAQRYYGEKTQFAYTYTVNDLSLQDQATLQRELGGAPTGDPSELELLGLFETSPSLRVEDREGRTVTDEYASVAGSPYRVVIDGAESRDYVFRYAVTSAIGTTTYSEEKGSAPLYVYRRPVILEGIYAGKDAGGQWLLKNFGTIYADTKSLDLAGLTEEDMSRVEFSLPDVRDDGTIEYYSYVENGDPSHSVSSSAIAPPTGQAVLADDLAKLTVTYRACFVPDRSRWSTFASNYFDQTTFDPDGTATRDVELRDLTLGGDALTAANYNLVYRDSYLAQKRIPGGATERTGVATDNNEDHMTIGAAKTYRVSGTGTVVLRPIETLTLDRLGMMDYTYGEVFSPQRSATGGSGGLQVGIHYATEFENAPERNVTQEQLTFATTIVNDQASNNFADRGLQIYYLKPGQTQEQALAAGQTLDNRTLLAVGEHDGARLFVTGRRGENDALKHTAESDRALAVAKRQLTVAAQDVHRFYGEPNGDFAYTIDAGSLADQDEGKELSELEGYAASLLTFRTDAVPSSPVGDGSYAAYDLLLTASGSLENYELVTQNAKIYVYPRPIRVSAVNSSADTPVYTIYSGNTTGVFHTILYNTQKLGNEATLEIGRPVDILNSYWQTLSNGKQVALPLTGAAIYGQDRLGFATTVLFQPEDWTLPSGETDLTQAEALVTVTAMASGEANQNYQLVTPTGGSQFDYCWGKIMLRSVDAIYVVSRPALNYTYGAELDLSGLSVRIQYKKKDAESSEAAPPVTLAYTTPEQFESYGLYVNYWEVGRDLPTQNQDRVALPTRYRQADSGDHLTIAPTHDTQGTDHEFAANGKTLVISAFSAGAGQMAATPKLLGVSQEMVNGVRSYEWIPGGADPATLTVAPLRLEYTLTAADKTYDGTTRAAGTLTLTNLFNQEVQTVAGRREQITDAVFVPIGAAYESDSRSYADFTALTDAVQGRAVSFTTGFYTPNAPAPLGTNGAVVWSNADYAYGQDLTFTFADANVHYEDDAFAGGGIPGVGAQALADYWRTPQSLEAVTRPDGSYRAVSSMPVEVTGMTLRGPDAANYTWGTGGGATSVTMTTRAAADQGQDAVPYATIHKANRATIQAMAGVKLVYPQLEVDDHTNVVRLTFGQDLKDMGDNNNAAGTTDPFQDELRFEYALLYQQDGALRTWAGKGGDAAYQDTLFFGGEVCRPVVDPGYVPDSQRIPKEEEARENTVYKGQRYRWAEEDPDFTIDAAAYPGGDSAPYLWYYTVYQTDRTGLPRDTVFYPLVRLSETHNYNPSGLLSGDANVTAEVLDSAQKALDAYAADPSDPDGEAAARSAQDAVFAAAQTMTDAARQTARRRVDRDAAQAEAGSWPDEPPAPDPAAPAVKSYAQRIDLLSATRERSQSGENVQYLVELLEAVWFTDTLDYGDSRLMDAVVYNYPARYYGYYWDVDKSAQLKFQEEGVSLRDVIDGVVIRSQDQGGSVESTVSVNPYDETVGGHTARIYVSIESAGTGSTVRSIRIVPSVLYARLGDEPFQLGVDTTPERPTNRRYTWSSSAPEVASVDAAGLVTFRGVGTAIITVQTTNGRSASITVVVSAVLPLSNQVGESVFNFQYGGAWAQLDEDYAFRPKEGMTRAQLVELLDLFLTPDDRWQATTELAYVDLTTREKYYNALRRLTNAGVVTGMPGGIFAGDQLATRAEFVTMLARMLRLDTPDTRGQVHAFADADETTTWAYAYIDALAKTGVIRGVGGGDFAPSRALTREEAAAIIARLLTTKLDVDQPGLLRPSDMTPENWSYPAVLRAVNAVLFPD